MWNNNKITSTGNEHIISTAYYDVIIWTKANALLPLWQNEMSRK